MGLQPGAAAESQTPQFQFSDSDMKTRGSVFKQALHPTTHPNTLSRCFKYTKHAG